MLESIRNCLLSLLFFNLLVVAYPLSAASQDIPYKTKKKVEEVDTTDEISSDVEQINNLTQQLNLRIEDFRRLSNELKKAPKSDQDIFMYRRDTVGFRLLQDLGALAKAAAKLPEDSELRQAVAERFGNEFSDVPDLIFERSSELSMLIDEMTTKLQTLTGSERFLMEAYLSALKDVRIQAYQAAADLIEDRKSLGLPATDLKEKLARILFLNAETLVGRIKFANSASEKLANQLQQDSTNTDLSATINQFNTMSSEDLERLQKVSDVLEKLGQNTSSYKSVLLQEGGTISVSDIESDILVDLMSESWQSTRQYFVNKGPDLLFNVFIFILVIFVFRALGKAVKRGMIAASERSKRQVSTLMKDTLSSLASGMIMLVGIFIALSLVGISLAPMLAGLGVAGFIVGFALQETLGNFAAGGMIILYRPYDVDDFVEVAGVSGLVKKMSLVSTTITTFDNQTLVIPNNKIWGDVIKNVTAQKVRRVDMVFGIGYDDDIEHAEKVLHEILDEHEQVLKKPEPNIRLHELGDSSVNFIVRPWVRTTDYWEVYWDVTREVKMRFDKEGISIPFPQRDVHLYREDEAAEE
ncbi:mechanosensitive ion channel family protein [Kangiella sp. TOML190]|uniref:mechanosensitive ion channel family protein n=1 Tax=Kangiella sp. TOML190 TaxID=2931351 RepID=UPI002041BA70|nr:mechanosensitive ion channel family protein [Kangiella sp. TOML190]